MANRVTDLSEYRAAKEPPRGDGLFASANGQHEHLLCPLQSAADGGAIGVLSAPACNDNGEPILGWMLSAAGARALAAQLLVEADLLEGGRS